MELLPIDLIKESARRSRRKARIMVTLRPATLPLLAIAGMILSGTAVAASPPAWAADSAGAAPAAGSTEVQPSVPGIPAIAMAAYRNAERMIARSDPGCGLSWSLLAGIGRIESGHANGGSTDVHGTTLSPILGPVLDGSLPGNEVIASGSGGYVRAIGPMQFLPSTWSAYAADGDGDGDANPNNLFDAALAAGKYLCVGGLDLRDPNQQEQAVLRYNHSAAYASNVLGWAAAYRGGGDPPVHVNVEPDPGLGAPAEASGGATPTESPTTPREPVEPATPKTDGSDPVVDPPVPATIPPQPSQPMIEIPGLPPIPCGIFCPAPPVGAANTAG
ncbi:lytic murein transglycosylase [Nocardia nepalensis]|uniref:lytic transglycosylase domain-containing protein n=1 Tax=Nocardia nepalensis TaxID=3375448 RepID=UPI003B672F92